MKPVQYAAFCRGEIDEDDFENIWTGYAMAEDCPDGINRMGSGVEKIG